MCRLILYAAVIMLYAALAISLRHQTKQQLDVAIVPRPDWACGLGILAAITWTLLTAVYSGDFAGQWVASCVPPKASQI